MFNWEELDWDPADIAYYRAGRQSIRFTEPVSMSIPVGDISVSNEATLEATQFELDTYRLDYVNRLHRIPVVTNIDMQKTYIKSKLFNEVCGDTYFSIGGARFHVRHWNRGNGRIVEEFVKINCGEEETLVAALEHLLNETGSEETEERFKLE